MRIVSIEQAQFGPLQVNESTTLNDGLNVWSFAGSSTKHTLLAFLEWVLYGPEPQTAGSNGSVSNPAHRWMPWDGGVPEGEIVIAPDNPELPRLLRVYARFDTGVFRVVDAASDVDFTSHFSTGSQQWNLGQILFGLERDDFTRFLNDSLLLPADLAPGEPHTKLLPDQLRQSLAGSAGQDASAGLAQLEAPEFSIGGSPPGSLRQLRTDVVKQLDNYDLDYKQLGQHLEELRDELTANEQAEQQLVAAKRALSGLHEQAAQLELAQGYYQHLGSTATANIPDHTQVAQTIDPQLADDVRQLAAELVSLANLHSTATQVHLQAPGTAQPVTESTQLTACLAELNTAQSKLDKARHLSQQIAVRIPPATRQRYADLEKQYQPVSEQLAAISEWQENHQRLNQELERLHVRREDLKIETRIKLPTSFWVGMGLILPAILMVPLFGKLPLVNNSLEWVGWLAGCIILAVAIVLIAPYWKMRRMIGPAATELRSKILPALTKARGQLQVQDRKRRRFLELLKLERTSWDRLAENVSEFIDLQQQMRSFQSARQEVATAGRSLEACWAEVGRLLPMAPVEPDTEWLAAEIARQDAVLNELAGMQADSGEAENYVSSLQSDLSRNIAQLAELLAPLGISVEGPEDIQPALVTFRNLTEESDELPDSAAEPTPPLQDLASFTMRWNQLPLQRQEQLARLVDGPASYRTAVDRLEQLELSIARLAEQITELEAEHSQSLERLEGFAVIEEQAARLITDAERADSQLKQLDAWQAALATTKYILESLGGGTGVVPLARLSQVFAEVLTTVPIAGIAEVQVSDEFVIQLKPAQQPDFILLDQAWPQLPQSIQRQLILALRLAIARYKTGRLNPLLLLDEPVAELADGQLPTVAGYLIQLAGQAQVIAMSCEEHTFQALSREQVSLTQFSLAQ